MADLTYATSPELPSPQELQLIGEIREASQAELQALTCRADDVVGDLRICRFLRARHGDAKEAGEWFREFLRWRVESGMDSDRKQVVGRSPEDFMAWWMKRRNPYLPMCPYGGRNKDGHVVWFLHQGRFDAKKFIEHRQVSQDEDLKLMELTLEWMLWHLDNLSRKERRMVYVIKVCDFSGLGAEGRKLPVFVPEFKTFMTDLLKSMQKYYCEHDSMFLLINTPFAFRVVFSVIKLLLTKRQISKFRILGDSSQADVRTTLRTILTDEVCATEYGGQAQRLLGMFPFPTAAEIQEWYQRRHLLPVEFAGEANTEAAAAAAQPAAYAAAPPSDAAAVPAAAAAEEAPGGAAAAAAAAPQAPPAEEEAKTGAAAREAHTVREDDEAAAVSPGGGGGWCCAAAT